MAVRGSLDRLKMISFEKESYEVVFPRYLPFCFGVDFHRQLCEIVDKCVTQKKRQISRLRSRRKSRS